LPERYVRFVIRHQTVVDRVSRPGCDAVFPPDSGQHEIAPASHLPSVVSEEHRRRFGEIERSRRISAIDVGWQRLIGKGLEMIADRDRVAAEIDNGRGARLACVDNPEPSSRVFTVRYALDEERPANKKALAVFKTLFGAR